MTLFTRMSRRRLFSCPPPEVLLSHPRQRLRPYSCLLHGKGPQRRFQALGRGWAVFGLISFLGACICVLGAIACALAEASMAGQWFTTGIFLFSLGVSMWGVRRASN